MQASSLGHPPSYSCTRWHTLSSEKSDQVKEAAESVACIRGAGETAALPEVPRVVVSRAQRPTKSISPIASHHVFCAKPQTRGLVERGLTHAEAVGIFHKLSDNIQNTAHFPQLSPPKTSDPTRFVCAFVTTRDGAARTRCYSEPQGTPRLPPTQKRRDRPRPPRLQQPMGVTCTPRMDGELHACTEHAQS